MFFKTTTVLRRIGVYAHYPFIRVIDLHMVYLINDGKSAQWSIGLSFQLLRLKWRFLKPLWVSGTIERNYFVTIENIKGRVYSNKNQNFFKYANPWSAKVGYCGCVPTQTSAVQLTDVRDTGAMLASILMDFRYVWNLNNAWIYRGEFLQKLLIVNKKFLVFVRVTLSGSNRDFNFIHC